MKNRIQQILLAEDNIQEYNIFVKALYSFSVSIDIIRVDDGYGVLNMLQTSINPDAIFLDINMRYKNGLLTLKEIKEANKNAATPIIILSRSDYKSNIDVAFSLGATYFVKKTGNADDLAATLKTIFSSPYIKSGTQPPKENFLMS